MAAGAAAAARARRLGPEPRRSPLSKRGAMSPSRTAGFRTSSPGTSPSAPPSSCRKGPGRLFSSISSRGRPAAGRKLCPSTEQPERFESGVPRASRIFLRLPHPGTRRNADLPAHPGPGLSERVPISGPHSGHGRGAQVRGNRKTPLAPWSSAGASSVSRRRRRYVARGLFHLRRRADRDPDAPCRTPSSAA
ncbi:MAG: hypothetical protein M0C28_21675 [Candidatus Moduliflexus flocculans]|nr:hypothetical protein [Candidatus Moduliflexus flocculans]